MRRTLVLVGSSLTVACGDSSGPGDRVFPAGTYDLAVPFNNVSAWSAPMPASSQSGDPRCAEFIDGTITIAANGDVTASRVFRQQDGLTYQQQLTGDGRFQDGVVGFLIDYGLIDEHAHAEQEGSTTALYVSHVFPTRGDCAQTTAAVRYVKR